MMGCNPEERKSDTTWRRIYGENQPNLNRTQYYDHSQQAKNTPRKSPFPNPTPMTRNLSPVAYLQDNHRSTDGDGNNHVQANGVVAEVEETHEGGARDGEVLIVVAVITAVTAAGGERSIRSVGGGSGFLIVSLGLRERILARVRVATALGLSLALEVTGVRSLVLVLVVCVEDVGELGLVAAAVVGTVDTSGGVAVNASADLGRLTADEAEDVTVALLRKARGGAARRSLDHAVAEVLIGCRRKSITSDLPGRGDVRALSRLQVRSVLILVNALGVGLLVLLGKVLEILLLGGLTTVADLDETVVILFLVVHVDDTTAENLGHLVIVKSGSLLELATGGTVRQVATVLSEEDWDRVLLEELDLLIVTRLLHAALTTPGVDVVAPEVDSSLLLTTVEVVGNLLTDVLVVVGGVANTEPAVALALDVLLGVTDGCLDVGRSLCVGLVVADFVTGEEANDVGVLSKLVDDALVAGKEFDIPLGVIAVDGSVRLAEIGDDVDTSVLKELHANRVVCIGIDGVGTDGVGTKLLEQRNITLAGLLIGQGVDEVLLLLESGTSSGGVLLVGNTLHEELGAVGVEELLAL